MIQRISRPCSAVALALLAAAAVGTVAATATLPAVVLRHDVPVNADLASTPYREHRAPGAAADPNNPNHLVVVDVDSAGIHCAAHASSDGGYTWQDGTLQIPDGWTVCKQQGNDGNTPPGQLAAAFGTAGEVYALIRPTRDSGGGTGPATIALDVSHDGGRTFAFVSFPIKSGGSGDTNYIEGSQYLAVDQTNGPRRGTIYVAATCDFLALGGACQGGAVIVSSGDGGKTFTAPVPVGAAPAGSAFDCCAEVAVGRAGEVDVVTPFRPGPGASGDCAPAYNPLFSFDLGCSALALFRSTDGGVSWGPPVPVYTTVKSSTGFGMGADPASGTVYAVLDDRHGNDDSIFMAASTDLANPFPAPVRVAQAAAGSDVAFPAGAATNGRFDMEWYLVRRGTARITEYDANGKPTGTRDASTEPCTQYAGAFGQYPGFGDTCMTDVYYGYSNDARTVAVPGGVKANSIQFDNLVGYEYGGDGNQTVLYGTVMVSTPSFARMFWVDSRNNAEQADGNQDQYSACAPFAVGACAVPAGYSPPIPGGGGLLASSGSSQGAAALPTLYRTLGRRVLRRDVYGQKPEFPPPIPGRTAAQLPPIIRTVVGKDPLVWLYVATVVAVAITLCVLMGAGLWRLWRVMA